MSPQPVFILVEPQMGENIGAAARALLNCGLTRLRLVNPREGWPNPRAVQMAAGASEVLDHIQVYESTREAVADLSYVLATTGRPRDIVKPVFHLKTSIQQIKESPQERVGILFGPERSGLLTEDLGFAHGLIIIPLNPHFSSLNLAQAVLLVAHEWWRFSQSEEKSPQAFLQQGKAESASLSEMEMFFQHLEKALDLSGFLHPPALRPSMLRNLRHLFLRAQMTAQEVQTFHGILTSFEKIRKRSQK